MLSSSRQKQIVSVILYVLVVFFCKWNSSYWKNESLSRFEHFDVIWAIQFTHCLLFSSFLVLFTIAVICGKHKNIHELTDWFALNTKKWNGRMVCLTQSAHAFYFITSWWFTWNLCKSVAVGTMHETETISHKMETIILNGK